MSWAKYIPILSQHFNPAQTPIPPDDIPLIILIDGNTNLDGLSILSGHSIEFLYSRFEILVEMGLISWKDMDVEAQARKYTGTERTSSSLGEAPVILGAVRVERRPTKIPTMPPPPPFPNPSSIPATNTDTAISETNTLPLEASPDTTDTGMEVPATTSVSMPSLTASIPPPPPFPSPRPTPMPSVVAVEQENNVSPTASMPPPPPFPGQSIDTKASTSLESESAPPSPPAHASKASENRDMDAPTTTEQDAQKTTRHIPAMPLTSWEKDRQQHDNKPKAAAHTEPTADKQAPQDKKDSSAPPKIPRLQPGVPLTSWEAQKLREQNPDATAATGTTTASSDSTSKTQTSHDATTATVPAHDTHSTSAATQEEEHWDSIDDWWALTPEYVGLPRKDYESILQQREQRQQNKNLGHQEEDHGHPFTPQWRNEIFGSGASSKS